MSELNSLLSSGNFDMNDVARRLDAMSDAERVEETRSWGRRAQANLFEAAKGHRKLGIDQLVPGKGPLEEVPHQGRNTLPAFTRFAKVFCRPDNSANELWGYNRSGSVVGTFVGPGYYVAYDDGDEVLIDYTRLPLGKPGNWPPILQNDERLSRFVYNGMADALRGVSEHVSIGRAIRNGKVMDSWFVLCRSELN